MKLVVFGSYKRLGALLDDGSVVDLNLAYAAHLKDAKDPRPQAHADATVPTKLLAFIEEGDSALKAAKEAVAYAKKKGGDLVQKPGVKIWAPLPSLASQISCAVGNYAKHVADAFCRREGRKATAEDYENFRKKFRESPPGGFWKMPRLVIGPDDPMIYPSKSSKQLDHEIEVAAIIGKKGKNISLRDARDYIYGYIGFNDWSRRDEPPQMLMGQISPLSWDLHKNFDTSCTLGPCIVTKDELPDPYKLRMELRVNGEVRQSEIVGEMVYKLEEYIVQLTRDFPIWPGDLVASGTCAGTAAETGRFLKVGDVVECKWDILGSFKNKIVAEK